MQTNLAFADRLTERLLDLEERMRAAVQAAERTPALERARNGPLTLGKHAPAHIGLSVIDARTILRAILPACLALGRTRRATLRLHEAMASFHAALAGTTEPHLADAAIDAGLALAGELAAWIDEMRWRQATRRAGVAWRRPDDPEKPAIRAVLRQSMAEKPEQNEATIAVAIAEPPPPPRRRRRDQAAGQVPLLLPLPGAKPQAPAASSPISETRERKSA